jgi:hypothetical protein
LIPQVQSPERHWVTELDAFTENKRPAYFLKIGGELTPIFSFRLDQPALIALLQNPEYRLIPPPAEPFSITTALRH